MTVHRNGIGQIKRAESNRDWRRAHLQGAFRMVTENKRTPESFGTRMRAALYRFFAV